MINAIMDSVMVSLSSEFGDQYKIHREAKRQGLREPCFFIQCVNPTSGVFLGKRYFRRIQFCVQYFPKDEQRGGRECCETAERLFSCLEYLDVEGDLVRGTKMRYEVADGILHFFVNYDMFVYKAEDPVPSMEEITREVSMKG